MKASACAISWTELFAAEGADDFKLEMRVIQKGGQPFIMLPPAPEMAAKGLSLYPAQTRFARAAKRILGAALLTRIPVPLRRVAIQLSRNDPFARFLIKLAGGKSQKIPPFAIIAGNPRTEGRRFLVLLFDEYHRPAFLVKAGVGEAAKRLIQAERAFLRGPASGFSGLPALYESLVTERVEALALAYVEGESPTGENRPVMAKLLGGWLDRNQTIHAGEVPAWQALEKAHGADPMFRHIAQKLADCAFHPTLFHGDFAPWNIQVSRTDGAWIVLDGERGNRVGFPAWDWFQYVVQTGILVEKLTAQAIVRRVENLLADASFLHYAESAGIRGSEKTLATAYLFHYVNMVRPSEGGKTAKALLSILCDRFL
ncbi:MAG: hypothetical protein JWQ04_3192 [Pedosphaera sp.]|nr:hypothetical protein [Pedosphaera sp.]